MSNTQSLWSCPRQTYMTGRRICSATHPPAQARVKFLFCPPWTVFCFFQGSGTVRDYPPKKAIPNVHCIGDNIKLIS